MRKLVTDVKVIPGEEVALQHQLLVCDMRIDVPPKSKRKFTPRLKVWKLKDPQTSNHFQEVFNLHVSTFAGVADGATEDIWNNIKTGLLKTTEEVCVGSPGRIWQAWGGSFLLLPRRHALSSRWLWTSNHNTCENRLEEVQGSVTSPLFTPPLFQNTWPCVQLLCVECNALCQRDLAIDKAEPPVSAAKWPGNDQTDLQCQAARHCHHQVQWATCAAWHWGCGPHSEGKKTSMVWTCGMLQWCNQDSLWHTGYWKAWAWEAQNDMEAADREGLQRVEALGYQPTW